MNKPDFSQLDGFIQNPAAYFMKVGLEIPPGMTDPDEMIDYLLRTNKINQNQYNAIYSQVRDLKSKGQLPKIF